MAEDFFDYDDEELAPRKRDHLFLWTVFILLLIGLAFACWMGSFYIFGHPEQARNYRLLQRLKKIEPLKRFAETKAPPGEFLSAQRLFERYSKYSRLQLERENAELLRTFLTNYKETKKLVPYLRGNFTIAEAAPLTAQDFMAKGMVALAQSNDFPQVLIEHLYPMNEENVAHARPVLVAGNPVKLEKTYDLGAVVHIEKIPDGRLQFTVVPLLYGSYALSGGVGTFSTEPPSDLNVEAGLPVLKRTRVETALKAFTDFRRTVKQPRRKARRLSVSRQCPMASRCLKPAPCRKCRSPRPSRLPVTRRRARPGRRQLRFSRTHRHQFQRPHQLRVVRRRGSQRQRPVRAFLKA
jgi:hypothetical protein